MAVAIVFALLLCLLGLWIWWTRRTYRGCGRWILANLLFALSMFLFLLRQVAPDWLSVVAANTLLVAGSILSIEANREFRGMRPRVWAVNAGGGLALAGIVYFEYVVNSINARICTMSLFMTMVGIVGAFTLLRKVPAGLRIGMTFTGAMFTIAAVGNFIRAVYFYSAPPLAELFAPSVVNSAFFVGASLAMICCSFGWVLLTDEQLVMDLRHAEDKTARANRELMDAVERANAMAKRAAAADAAKSEFLAIMSHEIRNPLSGVMAMTDLLLETNVTLEQQEYARTVRMSMEALLKVTDDVLDLSKIEAGRLTIESYAFDLRGVIEDVAKISAPMAKDKGLSLTVEYPADLPRCFSGDPGRIRQVIMNLLGNAVKFTQKGRIMVAAACDQHDGQHASIRISVSDTGMGIPAERIGSLFEWFSQAHLTNSRMYGGAGLGLAISKSLVELMGGRMYVESQVGKGSTFWFTLRLPLDTTSAPAYFA